MSEETIGSVGERASEIAAALDGVVDDGVRQRILETIDVFVLSGLAGVALRQALLELAPPDLQARIQQRATRIAGEWHRTQRGVKGN